MQCISTALIGESGAVILL